MGGIISIPVEAAKAAQGPTADLEKREDTSATIDLDNTGRGESTVFYVSVYKDGIKQGDLGGYKILEGEQQLDYKVEGLDPYEEYEFRMKIEDGIFNQIGEILSIPVEAAKAAEGPTAALESREATSVTLSLDNSNGKEGINFYIDVYKDGVKQTALSTSFGLGKGLTAKKVFDGLSPEAGYEFRISFKDNNFEPVEGEISILADATSMMDFMCDGGVSCSREDYCKDPASEGDLVCG